MHAVDVSLSKGSESRKQPIATKGESGACGEWIADECRHERIGGRSNQKVIANQPDSRVGDGHVDLDHPAGDGDWIRLEWHGECHQRQ